MPYLPIDPADIGRTYDAVIRVNSQSGKGGIAYLLETEYGIELPRRLQIDFARRVQERTDITGLEIDPPQLLGLFESAYLTSDPGGIELIDIESVSHEGADRTVVRLRIDGVEHRGTYDGIGPVEAVTRLLGEQGIGIEILSLHQASLRTGSDSDALTLIEYRDGAGIHWAAGRDRSILTAGVHAVLRAARAAVGVLTSA